MRHAEEIRKMHEEIQALLIENGKRHSDMYKQLRNDLQKESDLRNQEIGKLVRSN